MKFLQSSFLRALCAVIVGALLIQYRSETMKWLTIAIGVLFFISGIISCVSYFGTRKSEDLKVFDENGKPVEVMKQAFPIVGIGSLLLGIILATMPSVFVGWLMYILAAIVVLGAITQFMNLARAARFGRIGLFYWLMSSIVLLIALVILIYPNLIASAPQRIIGLLMMVYGLIECIEALKIFRVRRKYAKEHPVQTDQPALEQKEPASEPEEKPAEIAEAEEVKDEE